MGERIELGHGAWIDSDEVELRASRSSGPGGQHANVTASRIEARFEVPASGSLTESQKSAICARLGPLVTAVSQDTRSQARNRELAVERLVGRLAEALRPRRRRRRTRPTQASRRRRLEEKRRQSERKRLRRKPRADEH
jgi:ribosome-associated protein